MWLIAGMGWSGSFLPERFSHAKAGASETTQKCASETTQKPDQSASRASSSHPWSDHPEIGRFADAVVAGDDAARNTIWNHYCGMLMVRLARHPHIRESEECAQEILMEVYRRRLAKVCRIYDRERALLPLLMKALEFAIGDHLSRCRRAGKREPILVDPSVTENMRAVDPDAETLIIQEEKRLEARNTLIELQAKLFKELNEIEYAFYVLHYCDGLAITESGRLVGKSLDKAKAIKEKIKRKCKSLQNEMKEHK